MAAMGATDKTRTTCAGGVAREGFGGQAFERNFQDEVRGGALVDNGESTGCLRPVGRSPEAA